MPQDTVVTGVIAEAAATLREEARHVDERRLLVLAGEHDACLSGAGEALHGATIDPTDAIVVGDRSIEGFDRVRPSGTPSLLGTTHQGLVFDAHAGLRPNALGQVVGSVDGGGLFILLTPPLDDWPHRHDSADEAFAVPPFETDDVTGRFRERFVRTLREHRGIGIADVDAGVLLDDGLTNPSPRCRDPDEPAIPRDAVFPRTAYNTCFTADQADALHAFESLIEPGAAVVVEADRGRGKSSAAGIAAGALASRGEDILVTAPAYRSAREVFARTDDILRTLNEHSGTDGDPPRQIDAASGGRVRFAKPPAAVDDSADVVIVDEAAALPVSVLSAFLDDTVAFTTTIHGYEGAGRGFSVRFRDELARSDRDVTTVQMSTPIRYAAGDPVEVWSFRALLLNASPAVSELLEGAWPESVTYRTLEPDEIIQNEPLFNEAFGLLVLAHYRTEPDDLARMLDAPNVETRALLHDGHVASIALLAREGGLSAETRAHMYGGGRVRGNMLPDVLTSQLGDEQAGQPVGWRVLRIATHDAVRSRGLGSHLLEQIRMEFDSVDWLGAGYGATPELLSFWSDNDFSTVHLSTTRNDSSGEHSVLMLSPVSETGTALYERHATRFVDRIGGVLTDALAELDPDIARTALRSCIVDVDPGLSSEDWRLVARMAFGPGLMDVDPAPFRALALAYLIDPIDPELLSPRQERLLVCKALQARGWTTTAETLDYQSRSECRRAVGEAYKPLVDAYGIDIAHEEAAKFRDG